MVLTVLGLVALLAPFLALKKFKDLKVGFFYILLFIFFLQLIIALATQALHLFTYQVILSFNTLVFFACLFFFRPFRPDLKLLAKKIDLFLIYVVLISGTALYMVHYHYTGFYSTTTNLSTETKRPLNYPYPYFSDEWYSIAFIKDAIATHSLPVRDPIWHGPFTNLEIAFHSLLSEFIVILNLNPLTGYVILSIVMNTLIITLLYLFLAINKVKKLQSAIISLSALYIVNTSLIPGLWTLIPLSLGIIFLLLSIAFYYLERKKMFLLASFLTLIFYTPLILLIIVMMVSQLYKKPYGKSLKIFVLYMLTVIISGGLISSVFLFDRFTPGQIFELIMHKFIYDSYVGSDFIFTFPIYFAIPIPILLLATVGLPALYKEKRALAAMVGISLLFWAFYSFTSYSFIIELERIVIVASILLVLAAGFGLKKIFDTVEKFEGFKNNWDFLYLQYIFLFLFIPLLLFYTGSDAWKHFTGKSPFMVAHNLPLANRFLDPEDLRLFTGIKNARFLSSPWKGTVISVATNNVPLTIKSGTISGSIPDYQEQFRNFSCKEKQGFVKLYNLSYVYIPSLVIDCPMFQLKGVSAEGIMLYKTNLN
ncbi:MAG: hypothetical protein ACM3IJ_04210 [Candidatus Levyibacteriota bacterium]